MNDVSSKFNDELGDGEHLAWSGQPGRQLFTTMDLFLVPFSLVWGGFAFFWEYGVITSGAPTFMRLFGIPFVLMGLYFIVGRFVYKWYLQQHTYYAVTNKRIIVLQDSGKVTSAYFSQLPGIEKRLGRNGVGTIVFGTPAPYTRMYANTGMDIFGSVYGATAPAFYNITDADAVYRLVNKSLQA